MPPDGASLAAMGPSNIEVTIGYMSKLLIGDLLIEEIYASIFSWDVEEGENRISLVKSNNDMFCSETKAITW